MVRRRRRLNSGYYWGVAGAGFGRLVGWGASIAIGESAERNVGIGVGGGVMPSGAALIDAGWRW